MTTCNNIQAEDIDCLRRVEPSDTDLTIEDGLIYLCPLCVFSLSLQVQGVHNHHLFCLHVASFILKFNARKVFTAGFGKVLGKKLNITALNYGIILVKYQFSPPPHKNNMYISISVVSRISGLFYIQYPA